MLSRRQFAISAAVASGGLVGGLIGRSLAQSESLDFKRRLPIPALIDAAKQGNAVRLKVAFGRHAFIEGKPVQCYGYSAPVLGPAIRLRRGDEVEMTVDNALDVDTTVHWHGLLVPGNVDGGPQQLIKPGGTWRPRLKIDQPASTLWFHPHPHHDTARQIYMGLSGLIMVDDGSDARLGLPRTYGVDDLPIILQDRSFGDDGSLLYDLDPLTIQYGFRGNSIIANGVAGPVAKVPSGWVRLRILNAANAQNFELRFGDRREFHVIASDAGYLARPVATTLLRISPAERFEILVDFGNRKPVMLETGPDRAMGIFGAVSQDDTRRFRADHAFRADGGSGHGEGDSGAPGRACRRQPGEGRPTSAVPAGQRDLRRAAAERNRRTSRPVHQRQEPRHGPYRPRSRARNNGSMAGHLARHGASVPRAWRVVSDPFAQWRAAARASVRLEGRGSGRR